MNWYAVFLLVPIMVAVASAWRDLATHPNRMTKWEQAHPGKSYIPGYRGRYQCSTL